MVALKLIAMEKMYAKNRRPASDNGWLTDTFTPSPNVHALTAHSIDSQQLTI